MTQWTHSLTHTHTLSLSLKLLGVHEQVMGGTQKVCLGVDRLDYTKGIIERVLAFERLFEKYPKYKGQVSLLQVAVPSRTDVKEYQASMQNFDM